MTNLVLLIIKTIIKINILRRLAKKTNAQKTVKTWANK